MYPGPYVIDLGGVRYHCE